MNKEAIVKTLDEKVKTINEFFCVKEDCNGDLTIYLGSADQAWFEDFDFDSFRLSAKIQDISEKSLLYETLTKTEKQIRRAVGVFYREYKKINDKEKSLALTEKDFSNHRIIEKMNFEMSMYSFDFQVVEERHGLSLKYCGKTIAIFEDFDLRLLEISGEQEHELALANAMGTTNALSVECEGIRVFFQMYKEICEEIKNA